MSYEIDGVEFTEEHEEKGLDWDCWAVYKTFVVVGGETIGGVYDTRYEAVEAARVIAQDLYGSTAEYHSDEAGGRVEKSVATMTEDELSEALIDLDQVAFATVAEREVLFS
jgi:hypothetical protein